MIASEKTCSRCGKSFYKPAKISLRQWENREFCSSRCAATRSLLSLSEIRTRYLSGQSSSQIAKHAALSKEQVARIIKDMGITRSPSERISIALKRPEVIQKMSLANRGKKCGEHVKEILRKRTGPKNHNWGGGISLGCAGYLVFTASSANGTHANKLLHDVIAEWKIKRPLRNGEHVHHIDGNKLNNAPENLQVLSATDHAKIHSQQRTEGLRKWLAASNR